MVLDTVSVVVVAAGPVPPPPPPPLEPPPPHPRARLARQTTLRTMPALNFFCPGTKNKNRAASPVPALSVHQPFLADPESTGAAATSTGCPFVRDAVIALEGAVTDIVNGPVVALLELVAAITSGFGVQVTPGGNPELAQVIFTLPGAVAFVGVTEIVEVPEPPAVTVVVVPAIENTPPVPVPLTVTVAAVVVAEAV